MGTFYNPSDGKVYIIQEVKPPPPKGNYQCDKGCDVTKVQCSLPPNPPFLQTYTPFVVYIILGVILILVLAFLPTRAITKFFAASVALSWTSFWATIIYFICLGGSRTAAWFVILVPLFVSLVFTVSVLVGYVNLETISSSSVVV